jgi:protein-tyrosine phosphatase
MGMIDYHCHLLPAFDDGPATLDEALHMARALADFGFGEVHCTPHCIAGLYEFSPVEVRAAVDTLQTELDGAGLPLRLHPGMEYCLDDGFERFAANLLPLGDSRLVLCEASPRTSPARFAAMLELITVQGFIPLIAHPERSEMVWTMLEEQWRIAERSGEAAGLHPGSQPAVPPRPPAPPAFWRRWFSPRAPFPPQGARRDAPASALPRVPPELPESALFQANLASFAGFYGDKAQRRAYELLQRNGYHCFSSDLHDAGAVPACLEATREKLQFNPALQRLAGFVAPPRTGSGNPQLAFW